VEIREPRIYGRPDLPDPVIPSDAVVVERDANNEPTVVEANGEQYYPPGSLTYQCGFRTRTEYMDAQRVSANLGPHQVTEISVRDKPQLVLIGDAGRPVARYTSEQWDPEKPAYSPGIAALLQQDAIVRIPVKAADGNERLLTRSQVMQLKGTDGQALFELAIPLGLIPPGSRYVPGQAGSLDAYLGSIKRSINA
jgi:hypothetical protein